MTNTWPRCLSHRERFRSGQKVVDCGHWGPVRIFPELPATIRNTLFRGGWHTQESVMAASDAELLATYLIGPIFLDQIRAVYPRQSPTDFAIVELRNAGAV